MEKPKKKEFDEDLGYDAETNIKCIATHNQACDAWEKWLPSEEEIRHICMEIVAFGTEHQDDTQAIIDEQAKAISRRLGGEK